VSLCRRIRELRARAGLTQAQLAEKAGRSLRTIVDIETSETANPTRETLMAIAGALGVGVGDLWSEPAEAVV
jgi:transcriptional regulator with XRE-family HTH domain